MTLICFASQKGSPGATATALAVAASLKLQGGRRKVLLEADTTGGTLAIRYRLPVEPGLLTLAAAVRGGLDSSEGLWRHAQELPGGLPVIVCPDGPEQVHAAMAAGGAQLGRFLNGLRDVDVMCDVGRLSPDSPALPFVAEASAVLMVARPTAEQLQPAARRMLMLRPLVSNLGWVLVGQKPYGPADVEATYDFPVVGVMADDPRSVQLLERGTVSKRLRRQPFIRSATTLAETLSSWLSPLTSAADAEQASLADVGEPEEEATLVSEEAPAVELSPITADVDLSLLPPPAGEPDTTTPSPLFDEDTEVSEPVAEAAADQEEPVAHPAAEVGPAEDLDQSAPGIPEVPDLPEAPEVPEVSEDWGPPDVPEPPLVPALASAPLVTAPVLKADDPDLEYVSDETDPFPTESMRPVPPPPAPTGSRSDSDPTAESEVQGEEPVAAQDKTAAQSNGFAAIVEPAGLGWADLEPTLPAPDSPPSTQNGSPAQNGAPVLNGSPPVPPSVLNGSPPVPPSVLNGSPPVPPPTLSIDPPLPPLNGSPPSPPPPPLALDRQDGQAAEPVQPTPAETPGDDGADEDEWDGSEFTITADLTHVFATPDFDAPPIQEPRTEPPMPPMASVPPLPPASTQLKSESGDDRVSRPSPFPHEDSGADWTGW